MVTISRKNDQLQQQVNDLQQENLQLKNQQQDIQSTVVSQVNVIFVVHEHIINLLHNIHKYTI